MKAALQLRVSQQLLLTPQLQQSIRLLQLSTLDMNQEIERMLLENPMLEREEGDSGEHDDSSGDDNSNETIATAEAATAEEAVAAPSAAEDSAASATDQPASDEQGAWDEGYASDWGSGGGSSSRDDDDDQDGGQVQAAERSLADHLQEQIALSPFDDRTRALVNFLVDALDVNGYLDHSLEELLALLPPEAAFDLEELTIALRHLQSLDPVGVGARDLAQCLALQLTALAAEEDEGAAADEAVRVLALAIVEQHLDLLGERNFVALRRALGCDEEQLRVACELIRSLNPRPAAQYAPDETRYVIPDVLVRKHNGQWVVHLNEDVMPRLQVNALYAGLLQQNRNLDGAATLSGQLQEARWLIKNIQQRFDTILRVSRAIVDRQRRFFDYGEVAMKPLTLREIAEEVDLHESTISRVTTQKYMATPRGVFELKYFFGSQVATDSGGAASSTAIRALIRQFVDAEDRKKPLSDTKIAELLNEQGIVVARRTVAKYRGVLNIAAVSQRKTL